MGLLIDLKITAGGTLQTIGRVEITRQEKLENPENPYLEEHTYKVQKYRGFGSITDGPPVIVKHTYGEGAWALAEKALAALPDEPLRPRADI